jgi:hypothetical protein
MLVQYYIFTGYLAVTYVTGHILNLSVNDDLNQDFPALDITLLPANHQFEPPQIDLRLRKTGFCINFL